MTVNGVGSYGTFAVSGSSGRNVKSGQSVRFNFQAAGEKADNLLAGMKELDTGKRSSDRSVIAEIIKHPDSIRIDDFAFGHSVMIRLLLLVIQRDFHANFHIFQVVEIFLVQCAVVPSNAVIALAKIAAVLEMPCRFGERFIVSSL